MNHLNELFDNPYKYKELRSDVKRALYTFMSDNGIEMFVGFERHEQLESSKETHLYNASFGQRKRLKSSDIEADAQTNDGDQFKIFATVIAVFKEFYKKSHVGGVIIATKDIGTANDNISARKKIYANLIRKMSKGQTVTKDTKEYPNAKIILKPNTKLDRKIPIDRMW